MNAKSIVIGELIGLRAKHDKINQYFGRRRKEAVGERQEAADIAGRDEYEVMRILDTLIDLVDAQEF